MIELPEWAESRHNGYNRPPQTLKEFSGQLGAAFQPLNETFKLLGQAFMAGYRKGRAKHQQATVEGSVEYNLVLPEVQDAGWYELFAEGKHSQAEE